MKENTYVWVVVWVWRGLPATVELFTQEELAHNRERQIRQKLPPEDEVEVFQVAMPKQVVAE